MKTGRTTRMLQQAVNEVITGQPRVYLVGANRAHGRNLHMQFIQMLEKQTDIEGTFSQKNYYYEWQGSLITGHGWQEVQQSPNGMLRFRGGAAGSIYVDHLVDDL